MKRSEMLKILEDRAWWIIQSLSETRKIDAEIIAKQLLELCEDNGMLPTFRGKSSGVRYYTWEPE